MAIYPPQAVGPPPQHLVEYLHRMTLLWLIPLSLAATALTGYSIYQVHRQQTLALEQFAKDITLELDAELQRRRHGLLAVASVGKAQAKAGIQDWYNYAHAYDLTFDAPVLLVDSQRKILFNTRRPLGTPLGELPRPMGREIFDDALTSGGAMIGDVIFSHFHGRDLVPIAVPIGKTQALIAAVALENFENLLRQQPLPSGWRVAIFDSASVVIGSTTFSPTVHADDPPVARRARVTPSSVPWSVVVEVDAQVFYREYLKRGLTLVGLVSILTVGTAVVGHRASQGLVASVERLALRRAIDPSKAATGPPLPHIIEIENARSEMQRLSNAQHQAEEAERSRISRDLHDGLQQDAAAALINLDLMKSKLETKSELRELLASAINSLERVIAGIQFAVADLRPPSFELLGLTVTLDELVKKFTALTGVQVELEYVGDESRVESLPKAVGDCLYRVAQECLNNVRKHAQATFVHLEFDVSQVSEVRMSISDDGVGLSPKDAAEVTGFGMQSMVERLNAINGTLAVSRGHDKVSDRGTTVVATVPLSG